MMAEQQTALSAITNNFTDGATVASQVSKVFENVIAMTDSATNAAVRGVTDRSAFADTIKRCESILPTASQVSNIFADIERQREIFKMFESAADTSWMESAIRNLSMSSYEPPAPVTFRPAPRVQPEPLENARTYLQRLERNIESLEAEGKQVHLSYGLTPETVVVVIQLSSTDDPHYVCGSSGWIKTKINKK